MSEEDDKKQVVVINTSGSNFLMHHEGMSNAKILSKKLPQQGQTFIDLWRVNFAQLSTTKRLVHISLRLQNHE